jgi:hypothetical protein
MILDEFVRWFFSQSVVLAFPFIIITALSLVVGLISFASKK